MKSSAETKRARKSGRVADHRQPASRAVDADQTARALSRLPLLGSRAGRTDPQPQSGVLAYRRLKSGGVEVLLVRKLRSKNWGVPKGKIKPSLSPAENAAKEAFEEAGVKGRTQPLPAGTYRAVKRVHDLKIVIEVEVYLLEVTSTAKTWREKNKRDVLWCAPDEAANLLREPMLAELCRKL